MQMGSMRILLLLVSMLTLAACHEYSYHTSLEYDNEYIASDAKKIIHYPFDPHTTYRLRLQSFSGDADLTVYNEFDEIVVFSEKNDAITDEVIFTAEDRKYEIEIYGNLRSEYQLLIEQLPYDGIGISTSTDGIEFIIDHALFSGDIFAELASDALYVSHDYDYLSIKLLPSPIWLDVVPNSESRNNRVTLQINILETERPAAHNFATLRVAAENYSGNVNIYQDVDIVYQVEN